jgi:hypothetical protein
MEGWQGWGIIAGLMGLYFLPTAVAFEKKRNHHNKGAIFALNLLLGWTLIGWVGALVWALTKPSPSSATVNLPVAFNGCRPCPYCAEMIVPAARVCRFCGKELPAAWAST